MRRILLIVIAATAAIALIAALGLLVLLRTPPGRGLVVSIIEQQAGSALGADVTIGKLDGALPNHAVLSEVTLSANGETWLTIDRVELDWRALAALGGEIDIERLAVIRAHLLREPPTAKRPKPDEPFTPPRLPTDLPRVRIADFSIDDFTADPSIAGRPIGLDGQGRIAMGGKALDLRLKATGDYDNLSAMITLAPATNRGSVEVLLASEANGIFATLAKLDGRLLVEAQGDAPLSDFAANIDAEIGAYGVIDVRIAGNLIRADAVRIEASMTFGEKFSSIAREIGGTVALAATITQSEDQALVKLVRFRSAAGEASGNLTWGLRGDAIRSVTGNLSAKFAETYRSDIQSYIGNSATLQFTAEQRLNQYAVDGSLTTPRADLTIQQGETDLASRLSGAVTASLAPSDAFPKPLRDGFTANSSIMLVEGDKSQLDDLRVETPDGSVFQGDVTYDAETESIDLAGDAIIEPAMIAQFIEDAKPHGPVRMHIAASGPFDTLSGKAIVQSPAVAIGNGWLPESQSEITFINREAGIAADISGRAKDGGSLTAQISLTGAAISVPRFDIASRNFTVKAKGIYRRDPEAAEIDLVYKGDGPAQPWPGLTLAGEIALNGTIGRNNTANALALTAKGLRSDDYEVGSLDATAKGPSSELAIALTAEGLLLPHIGPSEKLQAAALVNLGEPMTLSLTRFEASAQGIDARLTSAAQFSFGDGVAVKNLKAALGQKGTLVLDGALSDNRWIAKLALADAAIPGADGFASLNLDLDTNRKSVASGDFVARAGLAETDASTLTGNFAWDGRELRVTNDNADDAIELDVTLPLLLDRSPQLSASLEGPMRGRISYDGRIEAFAPYLPYSLQALEGSLKGEARLAGTIDAPEVSGNASIANGAYTELSSGLSLIGIRGEASASASRGLTSITFDAGARGLRQGAETATIAGKATLGENARLDSVLKLNGTRLAGGPVTSAVVSGEIALSGPIDAIEAKGDLTLNELNAEIAQPSPDELVEIDVVVLNETAPVEADATATAPPLILALGVSGDDRIFVRGRGLDSEWRADVRATGDASTPLITGQMNLRRGYLDFAGRRFELTQGQISFDRLSPNNPTLDLRAEHEAEGVTAAIAIKGRAKTPKITLESTPALPQEDIMAIILFGKAATELTALESLQVAEALAQLTGVGPFGGRGITSIARGALGLDMLNLDIDADAGSSALEVGKYVADGLFISATQDARGESGAVRIEYEITDSITIETEIQQDGDQTVSANWKRDF